MDNMNHLIGKNKYTTTKPCKLTLAYDHPFIQTNSDLSDVTDASNKKKLIKDKSAETKLVTTTWNGLDPLSAAISSGEKLYNEQIISNESTKYDKDKNIFIDKDFVQWQSYRMKILNKFNTFEKLSIKSSFMFDKGTISTPNVSQKIKNRLGQLDDFEEGSITEMHDLTQQEYTKRIGEMSNALKSAWENDQRVKALKIAIQCTKQLSTINVIHFYPSKFVLITDILDDFGQLVYDRIQLKTNNQKENANETCRNWFYKISSIRELLPRFYIECSVLKIYSFLIKPEYLRDEYERIFLRLSKMIRGLGDPLVAIYCRVYLCRIVIKLFPEDKKIFLQNIYDIIDNVDQLTCLSIQESLMSQNVDYALYYTLFIPPLNWIFNCLFYKDSNTYSEKVLKYFQNRTEFFKNTSCSASVLSSMITCFPSSFLAQNIIDIIRIIKNIYKDDVHEEQANNFAYPKYLLIKNIGHSLVQEDDFFKEYSLDKNFIFAEFSELTKDLKSRYEYINCLETWSEIIAKFSDVDNINKFLDDIIQNISIGREPFENLSQLLLILSKIIINGSRRIDCEQFFSMNNLLPYLDLFHKENIKIEACKIILTSFNKNCSITSNYSLVNDPPDPVILNALTYLCKLIHDSIDSLTLDDEKRQISTLIIGFIRRVSFKQDLETRLNFYIESRANFSNLDQVLSFIVHQVNSLGMEAHRLVNGRHTKKTISFVNACIAFSYITIPSIYDIFLRLQLYLSSSHVSLVNGCLPQTDAFLKLTITLIRQLPSYSESFNGKLYSNDEFLHSYSSELLATLIVVPDNPELGLLYLFKGLYNVLKEYKFEVNSNYKILIWMNMIRYLSTCILDNYPYHVDRVDSNDTLYAQDDEFVKEIQTYYDIIFQEMLDMFKKSQHEFDIKQQCNVSLEFINLIIVFGNIQKMSHVINQLWNWTCKIQAKYNFANLDHKMKFIYNFLGKTFNMQLKTN